MLVSYKDKWVLRYVSSNLITIYIVMGAYTLNILQVLTGPDITIYHENLYTTSRA